MFSRVPAEFGLGFLRIAEQLLHTSAGRKKRGSNLHEHASCGGVDAFSSTPSPSQRSSIPTRLNARVAKFAHAVVFAGCYHIVVRLFLLEYEPHAFHIVGSIYPSRAGR